MSEAMPAWRRASVMAMVCTPMASRLANDGITWSTRTGGIVPRTALGTMPPVRVDQVIPSFASRDAIGVHTMAITEALRQAGIASDIFYGECTEDFADRARPMSSLGRPTKDRWLLYQASI